MINKIKNTKFLLPIVFLVVLPIPLLILLGRGLTGYEGDEVKIMFGLTAYVWMLFTLYLGTKPKWIDRLIGLPEIYFIHGLTSVLGLMLIGVHVLLLDSDGIVKYTGSAGAIIFAGVSGISLIYFSGWISTNIPYAKQVKKIIERYVNHELFVWFHRLNLIATISVFIHISLTPEVRNIRYFYVLLIVYSIIPLISYCKMLYDFYIYPNNGVLNRIERVDDSIVRLVINVNRKLVKSVKPGQFIFISFPKREKLKEFHPFSIVSANEDYIELTMSEVGDFTKSLTEAKSKDQVVVSNSYGILYKIISDSDKSVYNVIITGGIGITPMISLIDKNEDKRFILMYCVKKDKKLLFEDYLNKWRLNPNNKIIAKKGRFSKEELSEIVAEINKSNFILSGPPAMIESYKKMLKELGVKEDKIFFEAFNW